MTFARECFWPLGQLKSDLVVLLFRKTFERIFDGQTENHAFKKDLLTNKILQCYTFKQEM